MVKEHPRVPALQFHSEYHHLLVHHPLLELVKFEQGFYIGEIIELIDAKYEYEYE